MNSNSQCYNQSAGADSCGAKCYVFQGNSPTVRAAFPFNPKTDVETIGKAMKGIGIDEIIIIAVLSKRTNMQRLEIAKEYKAQCGRDLLTDLKNETKGHFQKLVVALLTPIVEFYANEVSHSLKGATTDKSALVEMLVSLSAPELQYLKAVYREMFGADMEAAIRASTSGLLKRLLTSLCQAKRPKEGLVDPRTADADACTLLRAGELRVGTDETSFNSLLCNRSLAQLEVIFATYEHVLGCTIEESIARGFSGDVKQALLAIVSYVRNKPAFFASYLYKSMKGMRVDYRTLIRIIVTRSEVDLAQIKREFFTVYGKPLVKYIKAETSGDLKTLIMALLGE